MPATLSIKNVPDAVLSPLRARALRNHRSLQGELLAIVSAAAAAETVLPDYAAIHARALDRLGESRSSSAETVAMVREDRDR
jgi:antitoxin FitA